MCATGLTLCDGICTDLQSNAASCGACDVACGADTACVQGVCLSITECPHTGDTLCGSACVDLTSDVLDCGACGHACAISTTCSAGVCVTSCSPELTMCGSLCVDLKSDPDNCGACGHRCGTTCSGGVCDSSDGGCGCTFGTPGSRDSAYGLGGVMLMVATVLFRRRSRRG
jgi:hypothetical protein